MPNASRLLPRNGSSSRAPEKDPPKTTSPIEGAVDLLQKHVEDLDSAFNELEARLSPVLRNSGPDSAAGRDVEESSGVPIVDAILQPSQRVAGVIVKIQRVLDRLAL